MLDWGGGSEKTPRLFLPQSLGPPGPTEFGFGAGPCRGHDEGQGAGSRLLSLWGGGPGNPTAVSWERVVPFPGAQPASGRGPQAGFCLAAGPLGFPVPAR